MRLPRSRISCAAPTRPTCTSPASTGDATCRSPRLRTFATSWTAIRARAAGRLSIARGIEVGHVFQLGCKYSEAMKASVQDEQGRDIPMHMGCYGIGVTRIVAAAIEQNHDERGIIWPAPLAPFDVVLVGLNWEKSEAVRERRPRPLPRARRGGHRGAPRRPRCKARRQVRRRGTAAASRTGSSCPSGAWLPESSSTATGAPRPTRNSRRRRRSISCRSASRPDEEERLGPASALRGLQPRRSSLSPWRPPRRPTASRTRACARSSPRPSRKRPASPPSTTTSCGSR